MSARGDRPSGSSCDSTRPHRPGPHSGAAGEYRPVRRSSTDSGLPSTGERWRGLSAPNASQPWHRPLVRGHVPRRLRHSGHAMEVPADAQSGKRPAGGCHLPDRHLPQLAAAGPRWRDRDEPAAAALKRDPRQRIIGSSEHGQIHGPSACGGPSSADAVRRPAPKPAALAGACGGGGGCLPRRRIPGHGRMVARQSRGASRLASRDISAGQRAGPRQAIHLRVH